MKKNSSTHIISKACAASELVKRRAARQNMAEYVGFMHPGYVHSEFSRTICSALENFLDSVMGKKRPVLILQGPPQHGKSELISKMFPSYAFGRYPDLRIAGCSYGADLAEEISRDLYTLMHSDSYRVLFPDVASFRKDDPVGKKIKKTARFFDIAGHKGSYIAMGVGGPLTGRSVNIGIVDDPYKNMQEARSKATNTTILSWYHTVFLTRLQERSGQLIMSTSWTQNDLVHRIASENPNAEVIKFPALSADNEALIPGLHSAEKLLETKAMLSVAEWSAMYQQNPIPEGGAIFTSFGVNYCRRHELPKSFNQIVLSWDMAFKDSGASDYVVGQVWGKQGANSYLLEQVRDRMSFTRTLEEFRAQSGRYTEASRKYVEEKANGAAIIDVLKNEIPGIIPVNPGGSKESRAHACQWVWEAGNIFLPHPDEVSWVKNYVDELLTFPLGTHDDQVDATTQAILELYPHRTGIKAWEKII